MVHAYPWLPDIMAVAAVVAAEEGDAEALSHLRADSSGGPGAFVQPLSHPQASKGEAFFPNISRSLWKDHSAMGSSEIRYKGGFPCTSYIAWMGMREEHCQALCMLHAYAWGMHFLNATHNLSLRAERFAGSQILLGVWRRTFPSLHQQSLGLWRGGHSSKRLLPHRHRRRMDASSPVAGYEAWHVRMLSLSDVCMSFIVSHSGGRQGRRAILSATLSTCQQRRVFKRILILLLSCFLGTTRVHWPCCTSTALPGYSSPYWALKPPEHEEQQLAESLSVLHYGRSMQL